MKHGLRFFTQRTLLIGMIGISVMCSNHNTQPMKIKLTQLPVAGLSGDLAKGVSAAYAAWIDGNLLVAGGANFPGKLGFEGGSKVFYSEIMQYDVEKSEWIPIGHLPDSSAYGVSVTIPDGALWIGGNTAVKSLAKCYKVNLLENHSVKLNPFPSLPVTMDNFAGCSLEDLVFVGGGNENGKPSNRFYSIQTKSDTAWTKLPNFPGIPRVQPIMAALEIDHAKYIYLLGGFFGGDDKREPAMATEVLRYDIAAGRWEKAGEQRDPVTDKPFSLGGATAMPVNDRYILCLGGVNHDIFLNAVTAQHKIATDTTLTDEERKRKNFEFSKHYMTQPIEYYKFNPECRIFDTCTGEWKTIEVTPATARAGATLVFNGTTFYIVQGELKPGVRAPETWEGRILAE